MTVHQRILVGATASLEVEIVDGTGELASASGSVSVVVTRSDGTAVLSGSASAATTGLDVPNPYSVTLPAASNTQLDELTAVWTDAGDGSTHTTTVGVVGGIYAPVSAVRRSDPTLTDPVKYSDAEIVRARMETETEFELVCGRSFVPRLSVQRFNGTGARTLRLPMPNLRRVRWVRELSSTGAVYDWTPAEIAAVPPSAIGEIVRTDGHLFPAGKANIVIAWEHGVDVVPDDVRRAALLRIRDRLNRSKSAVPDRATTFTVAEGGTFALSTPGRGNSITGIPDVDVVLARWAWRPFRAGMVSI